MFPGSIFICALIRPATAAARHGPGGAARIQAGYLYTATRKRSIAARHGRDSYIINAGRMHAGGLVCPYKARSAFIRAFCAFLVYLHSRHAKRNTAHSMTLYGISPL